MKLHEDIRGMFPQNTMVATHDVIYEFTESYHFEHSQKSRLCLCVFITCTHRNLRYWY